MNCTKSCIRRWTCWSSAVWTVGPTARGPARLACRGQKGRDRGHRQAGAFEHPCAPDPVGYALHCRTQEPASAAMDRSPPSAQGMSPPTSRWFTPRHGDTPAAAARPRSGSNWRKRGSPLSSPARSTTCGRPHPPPRIGIEPVDPGRGLAVDEPLRLFLRSRGDVGRVALLRAFASVSRVLKVELEHRNCSASTRTTLFSTR